MTAHKHHDHGHDDHIHESGWRDLLGHIFDGGHDHDHGIAIESDKDILRLKVCMWLNGVYGFLQLAVAIYISSALLITDALHNISDIASVGMPLFALMAARRPADGVYTQGHGRKTITAAFVNFAMLIIFLVLAISESVMRLVKPESAIGSMSMEAAVPFSDATINAGVVIAALAGFGIIVNLVSVIVLYAGRKRDLNMASALAHQFTDLVNSVVAAIGGILVALTGITRIDPVLTIAVSSYLIWVLRHSVRKSWVMINGGVSEKLSNDTRALLGSIPGVTGVHALSMTPLSTTSTTLSVHLVVAKETRLHLRDIRDELSRRLHIVNPTIQVESEFESDECNQQGSVLSGVMEGTLAL